MSEPVMQNGWVDFDVVVFHERSRKRRKLVVFNLCREVGLRLDNDVNTVDIVVALHCRKAVVFSMPRVNLDADVLSIQSTGENIAW